MGEQRSDPASTPKVVSLSPIRYSHGYLLFYADQTMRMAARHTSTEVYFMENPSPPRN